MGGDEASPLLHPIPSQFSPHGLHHTVGHRRRRYHNFAVNSLVEVQTNEDDFKGVYFSAEVIAPPSSSKKSSRKKSRKLYVEYHNLLAHEDGSDRLREYVDMAFVRPAPPEQEIVKGFEPGDIVDAFYKDGWWTGVVNRALAGGERFVVTFHNPPDELEFGLAELRAHLDWVNGNWVRPKKQSITGLMFDVGRKVEVSFDREDFQVAWFPATICEDLGNDTFLVDYCSATADNHGYTKASVDSLHIRPCPPLVKDKNFVLLEKVDAFFDFGWWNGVTTQELENSRYVVYFKEMKCKREFSQSELRSHMEWKDGKWFTSSQESSIPTLDDKVCVHHSPERTSVSVATAPVSNSLNEDETCFGEIESTMVSTNGQSEQFIPGNQKLSCVATFLTKKRAYFSDSGDLLSQPLKKPSERNLFGANEKDVQDRPNKEFLCGVKSPESLSIMENCMAQTTLNQFSSNHSWEENVQRKQRNTRTAQIATGKNISTSSSLEKSTVHILPLETRDKEPVTPGNTEEVVQNKPGKNETELPVLTGLSSAKTWSSGISGGYRTCPSNKKVLIGVDDQRQQVHDFTSQKIKDDNQLGITDVSEKRKSWPSEKRKRGRPKRILVESTKTLVTVMGNAEHGGHGSGHLNKKAGDLHRLPEVVVTGIDASKSTKEETRADQEKISVNQETATSNQEKATPNQETATLNQVKVILNKEKKAIQNQEKAIPNHEKTARNQENATPDQEMVTRNLDKATANQEKGTPNQEKATPKQAKLTPNPDKATPNQKKATPNREKATPNQKKATPNQENQEKTMLNHEKIAITQSGPGKRKVSLTKRILASKHERSGVEESVRLEDDRSPKRGRKQITNGRIAVKVRDLVVTSGGKATRDNREMDIEEVIEPSNDLDNEPLSKWIEEIHMSSVIDSSRLLPADTGAQCIVNGDTHGDCSVLDEASEKQPGSHRLCANLVDKGDIVSIEPQKPSENNNAGLVLDEGTQEQFKNGTQTPSFVDKVPVGSEPQRIHSVEKAAVALLDQVTEKQPEKEAWATDMVDKSPSIPSRPQISVEKTIAAILNEADEKLPQDRAALAPTSVDKVAILTSEPGNLPFVKNTILWKTIESMEVFKRLPQTPHFQPLNNFKESSREGLAIGYMVTFSSVIERASKLQLNDPISIMEDIKETLADLEKHGFHVRQVLDCITEMIAMKYKRGKLVNNEHTLHCQISEHLNVKTRKQREMEEIQEHIKKLQIKLAQVELSKEREDEEIAFAQVRLRETHDSIVTLEKDFEQLVSSIL